jgi:hypothetical protein
LANVKVASETLSARNLFWSKNPTKNFGRKQGVQALGKISGLFLAAVVIATLTTGCETGRVNKRHSVADHMSDVSTTGQQDSSLASNGEGLPPVPGSPTAAGIDGKQPYNDSNARPSPGVEGGHAAAPNQNHKEAFQRQ